MPDTLLERTKLLLAQDARTTAELSRVANVGYHWLWKFRLGKIKSPGIIYLERLHTFLANAR